MAADNDSHLLFGLLALQNGLIDQADLVAAFQTWSKGRDRPLAQVLLDRGALTEADRTMLEALVRRHVEKHGGDTDRSLAAVGQPQALRAALGRVDDVELNNTLTRLSAGTIKSDPLATAIWSPGVPGSEGDRFRVLRPHAKGGLGLVSVALDAELHREVALKEIRPEQADDPNSRARFLLEAELTGRLEHPGVVPVYAIGADARGRPYYVMRFVRGDSLKEAIDRHHGADADPGRDPGERGLKLRKLLARFVAVCDAVSYAHSRGVIHRDIKPSNILLGPFGETLVVDWGLAKVVGRDEPAAGVAEETLRPATASGSSETQAGSAIGTPAYMSPEQAEGRLEVMGPASDVYSLGATLFALLTGRPPLEDRDIVEVLRKVRTGEIPPAREVNPRVPPALEAVCRKAMALDLRERYPSARAIADEVEHWLADEPVSAYGEPWWGRARRHLKRHRSLVGALAIAGPVAIISLASIAAHEGLTKNELEKNNAQLTKALDKAKRREDLTFQALDNYQKVISDIPELQQRPDLLPIRRRLLQAPQQFYQQLREEIDEGDPSDRKLDRETIARIALADFGLASIGAEIGSESDAMKAYGQAIEAMESLVRETGQAQYRQELALALNNLGKLRVDAGRLKEARGDFDRTLALQEDLFREDGGTSSSRSDLARIHHNLGWLDSKTGRADDALAHYRKAWDLREALAREAPNEEWRRTALAQTGNNLGWMLSSLRRRDEARRYLVQARDILEDMAARQPTYVSYRADLALTCEALASLEEGDDTLAPLQRAVDLRDALAREAPSIVSSQASLATSLMLLGNVHRIAKRFDLALAAQERAVAVLEPVIRNDPEAGNYRQNLASCLNHLGLTLVDANRPAEALSIYGRSLDLLAPVLRLDPANAEVRSLIAGTHNNRGLALAKLGRHEEALEDYREAIKQERVCFDAAPQLYQYRKWLSMHIHNMGKSLRALGRLDEAYATYRDRMKLWAEGPPEHRSPDENYDAACSLALLVPAVGGGKPDDALTEAERAQRRQFTDEAFAELRAAVDGGFDRAAHFARDPDFDAIRADPRFAPLLLRVMDRTFPADPFARSR